MKAFAVLVMLVASSAPVPAAGGPGEAALSFLRGLTRENGVFAVGDTAISPDTPEQRRADIAVRLSKLGRAIRPDDLRVLEEKLDGELAAVLVSQITNYDSNSVQVHAVGMVKGAEQWRPAPLPSSFDNTGLSFRPGFLPRIKALEDWMLRARGEQLVRLKEDAFVLLFEEMRKLRSPDELHEATPDRLAADFLAALKARSLPGALALLGGLEDPRPAEWDETFQAVARVLRRPEIEHPHWRLLAAPEAARAVVMTEQGGEDGMVSIVALDPAGDYEARPRPRAVHLPFVRSDGGLWRIRLPSELLAPAAQVEVPADDEDLLDADLVAAFPAKLRDAVAASPEATSRGAAEALLLALRAPSFQALAPRLDLEAESAVALDGMNRAARLWQRFHLPDLPAAPVLLELHESGDDACALVQVFSARLPVPAALQVLFFRRGPAGWLANPGFSGAPGLAHAKDSVSLARWSGPALEARERDWTAGLIHRLGGIPADSAPTEDEAREAVSGWRDAIVAGDVAGMLARSACFDDPAGSSRLLRNSGYELTARQRGNILGVHRAGRWAAVSMRVPPAAGDDSADSFPLFVVVATESGPRVLPELDLFDSLARGRELLNRQVWLRLDARLPEAARGELETIFQKHRTLSAADRQLRPNPAE
jgi:hypothetical protein